MKGKEKFVNSVYTMFTPEQKERLPISRKPCYQWSGWRDSNSRSPAPKAGALTGLGHTPN